jgi:hypothetical protein
VVLREWRLLGKGEQEVGQLVEVVRHSGRRERCDPILSVKKSIPYVGQRKEIPV